VFKVVTAGCGQRGLQLGRPLLVGLSQPPHLVRSKAKVAEHRAERLTGIDSVEQLLSYVGR
jgi:hypothetical protein